MILLFLQSGFFGYPSRICSGFRLTFSGSWAVPVPVNDVSLQVILFLRTHFFCEKTNRHLLFLQKSFSTGALFRTHGDKKADVRFCFVHLSMNICFHRKRFTNLSSRFPDSQIFTAAAPSHAFRTMAFLQLTLPAYSDRIAQDFHPIPFYLRGFFFKSVPH